jgi:hypothetical protein
MSPSRSALALALWVMTVAACAAPAGNVGLPPEGDEPSDEPGMELAGGQSGTEHAGSHPGCNVDGGVVEPLSGAELEQWFGPATIRYAYSCSWQNGRKPLTFEIQRAGEGRALVGEDLLSSDRSCRHYEVEATVTVRIDGLVSEQEMTLRQVTVGVPQQLVGTFRALWNGQEQTFEYYQLSDRSTLSFTQQDPEQRGGNLGGYTCNRTYEGEVGADAGQRRDAGAAVDAGDSADGGLRDASADAGD